MTGKVKWFDLQRGIGFVVPDVPGREAIIHYKDILAEGFKALYEGDIVVFDLEAAPKGPKAHNLRVLQSAEQ